MGSDHVRTDITNSSTTPCTLTIDQNTSAGYFGSIQDGSAPVSLVYAGTANGVLVAAGTNGYSGSTTIQSGLFVALDPQSLPWGTALS